MHHHLVMLFLQYVNAVNPTLLKKAEREAGTEKIRQ
jgi:hypothetical protein